MVGDFFMSEVSPAGPPGKVVWQLPDNNSLWPVIRSGTFFKKTQNKFGSIQV
jgi:hypothetical protein